MKKLTRVGPAQNPPGAQVGPRGAHAGVAISGLGSASTCAKSIQSRCYKTIFLLFAATTDPGGLHWCPAGHPSALLRGPVGHPSAPLRCPTPVPNWDPVGSTPGPNLGPRGLHSGAQVGPRGPPWAPLRGPGGPHSGAQGPKTTQTTAHLPQPTQVRRLVVANQNPIPLGNAP